MSMSKFDDNKYTATATQMRAFVEACTNDPSALSKYDQCKQLAMPEELKSWDALINEVDQIRFHIHRSEALFAVRDFLMEVRDVVLTTVPPALYTATGNRPSDRKSAGCAALRMELLLNTIRQLQEKLRQQWAQYPVLELVLESFLACFSKSLHSLKDALLKLTDEEREVLQRLGKVALAVDHIQSWFEVYNNLLDCFTHTDISAHVLSVAANN